MKITIQRKIYSDTAIAGELFINKEFICYTLELAYLDNKKNISSIPEGIYSVVYTATEKLELLGTGERTNIQIHKGNTVKDSTGCILVGASLNTDGSEILAGTSTPAYDYLKRLICKQYSIQQQPISLSLKSA